jgi:hypothetical protein
LLVLAVALVAAAGYALKLRCEGFGCTGVGVLWVAWAIAYLFVLALSLAVRAALPAGSPVRGLMSAGSLGLVVLGLLLLAYWQFRNASA